MASIHLTSEDLCAIHYWPFPCEEGAIIDPPLGPGVFPDGSGGVNVLLFSAANRSASVDQRLLSVAHATGATISRAVVVQQSADTLEGAGDTVLTANRSAIGKFVDGLVASPPICEQVPPPPVPVGVWGIWFIPLPPPPPTPPEWKPGEQLSAIDLLSVGTRFQAAAAALKAGPLREEFLAAGARLFEVATERL
jgi:hypothetical protein